MTKAELQAALRKCRANLTKCQNAYAAYRAKYPPIEGGCAGPPSGTLVFHDWADTLNPTPPWDIVTDHFSGGGPWTNADTQVIRVADQDNHVRPVAGGFSPYARELLADPDQQSMWDAQNQGCSTRTQLRKWTLYLEGQRTVTWFSFKLNPTDHVLNGTIEDPPSAGDMSDLCQFQSTNGQPMVSLGEQTDGARFIVESQSGGPNTYWGFNCDRDKWIQVALDQLASADPAKAAFRLWADLGTGLGLQPITEKITGLATLAAGASEASLSIGPYQEIPSCHATAPQKVRRRYANVAVVSVSPGANWG